MCTYDEVLVNGTEVEVYSGTGLNIYSNHAEDIDIALVEKSLGVEQKSTLVVSEKGDSVIIKAASILVNAQLENSEIIRSDGNEFLIYMVGYNENQIDIYAKKLSKSFKELPYGFGAAIGYSMINDNIKTIDDAINEATIEMQSDKESYK